MYRGTTPSLIFELDEDLDYEGMAKVEIALRDKKMRVFVWNKDRLEIDNETNTITLLLTQWETNIMAQGKAEVQIRCRTSGGAVFRTDIATIEVERVVKGGLL